MSNKTKSPLAGKTVKIKREVAGIGGKAFAVTDWYDRANNGHGWRAYNALNAPENVKAYTVRAGASGLPIDDRVLVGEVFQAGGVKEIALVHETEILIEGETADKQMKAAA